MSILQHHRDILVAAAISDEQIAAACIESITSIESLTNWGFSAAEAKRIRFGTDSSVLLFPGYGVTSDTPTFGHLTADGVIMIGPSAFKALYVPPSVQSRLDDPNVPIWITERETQALALASLGECAIALPAVMAWRSRNVKGGYLRLSCWNEIALNERRVYLAFDSDTPHNPSKVVQVEKLFRWLRETRKANPLLVISPSIQDAQITGIESYLASGKSVLDVVALAISDLPDFRKIAADQAAAKRDPDGPAVIETNNRRLRDMTDEAMTALVRANTPRPRLFIRSGRIVHVLCDEHGRAGAHELRFDGIRHYLERCAEFQSTSDKRGAISVIPPESVCRDILVKPDIYDIPALAGITTAPTFAPDGALLDQPGYQSQTKTYYHPSPGFILGDTQPTPEKVTAALSLLFDDLLVDFPIVDDDGASRSHALGLMLLPFVRSMIDGPTPLHVIEAPTAGTGKTKFAVVCMIPFLGQIADARSAPTKPEEWDKMLFAAVGGGSPVILIDNARELDSATLEMILTSAGNYTSRVLGVSAERTYPVQQTWITTANNMRMFGDLGRRAVSIRLDAGIEDPEERHEFRHNPLEGWAITHHSQLAAACVTLIRSWIEAGRPAYTGRAKGSYESWCAVVGAIVQHHGFTGFLGNTDEATERMDTRRTSWRSFFEAWFDTHGESLCGAQDVLEIASRCIPEDVGEREGQSRIIKLGKLLRSQTDRVFSGFRLLNAGKDSHTKSTLYRLTKTESAESAEPADSFTPKRGGYPNGSRDVMNTTHAAAQNTPQAPHSPQIKSVGNTKKGSNTVSGVIE